MPLGTIGRCFTRGAVIIAHFFSFQVCSFAGSPRSKAYEHSGQRTCVEHIFISHYYKYGIRRILANCWSEVFSAIRLGIWSASISGLLAMALVCLFNCFSQLACVCLINCPGAETGRKSANQMYYPHRCTKVISLYVGKLQKTSGHPKINPAELMN